MTESLRDRLDALFAVSSTGNTDKVLAILNEHLTSPATIEDGARALHARASSIRWGVVATPYREHARVVLAAALAPEKEASNG